MGDGLPRQVDGLEVSEAEDGLVVYDPASDMVHHLNPSASLIFDLCDATLDPDGIAAVLAELYGMDAPPRDETLAGLADLARRGLIRWSAQDHAG